MSADSISTTPSGRNYGGVSAEERVAARRARFLDAGLELFGTAGYTTAGVRDICREAGFVDRYFYESFRDKEALFLEVFDRVCDDLFAAVAEAVIQSEPTAAGQLRAAVGTFLREMDGDARKPRLVFSEPAAVGVDAEAHMRATLRRFAELASATARAHVPPDTPDDIVRLVGLAVVGTIERVVIEWQDGELDKPIDQIEDDCVTLFVRLLDA